MFCSFYHEILVILPNNLLFYHEILVILPNYLLFYHEILVILPNSLVILPYNVYHTMPFT